MAVSDVMGRVFIYRIAECKGVSPSMREMGSHSNPSWSRRVSIISSIRDWLAGDWLVNLEGVVDGDGNGERNRW